MEEKNGRGVGKQDREEKAANEKCIIRFVAIRETRDSHLSYPTPEGRLQEYLHTSYHQTLAEGHSLGDIYSLECLAYLSGSKAGLVARKNPRRRNAGAHSRKGSWCSPKCKAGSSTTICPCAKYSLCILDLIITTTP